MGYSFHIISRDKDYNSEDLDKAMSGLSEFNQKGLVGRPPCDLRFYNNEIRVSGSFGVSGQYVEGFILDLMIQLWDLGYRPRLVSWDWDNYGTEEEKEWVENNNDKREIR